MSRGSKVIAWTDRNTDTQTDTDRHTDIQTDRHDWKWWYDDRGNKFKECIESKWLTQQLSCNAGIAYVMHVTYISADFIVMHHVSCFKNDRHWFLSVILPLVGIDTSSRQLQYLMLNLVLLSNVNVCNFHQSGDIQSFVQRRKNVNHTISRIGFTFGALN